MTTEDYIRVLDYLKIDPDSLERLIEIHREQYKKKGHNDYFNSVKRFVIEGFKERRRPIKSFGVGEKEFKLKRKEYTEEFRRLKKLEWKPIDLEVK